MKFKFNTKIVPVTVVCLLLFSTVLYCQTYSFKNYGIENNIPNGIIYTIDQTSDGFLWVGTGAGISRFDGYNFFPVRYPDSSALRLTTASIKDRNGNLWYGCNDGTVYFSRKFDLVQVKLDNEKSISEITQGPDGLIYVVPQGRAVFTIDPANPAAVHKYMVSDQHVMLSAGFAGKRRLLIGTQEKLLICDIRKDTLAITGSEEGFDYSAITAIVQTGDSTEFAIGTDGNGLYRFHLSEKGNTLSRFRNHPELDSLSIHSLFTDNEQNLWLATFGSGAIQLRISFPEGNILSLKRYNISTGLGIDNTETVYQDLEGNYWIGTYGEGISMLTSYAFGYFSPGKGSVQNNILYVSSYKGNYILGTPGGFHIFDPAQGKSLSYTDLTGIVGNTEITSYLADNQNNIWIGTGGKGLFLRSGTGQVRLFYRSGDSGADYIKDIEIDNQNLWLATTNGVILLDKGTGAEKHRYDINNGLPHNSINKILVARDGNVYIGTEGDRLYFIDHEYKIVQRNGTMYGSTINKILSFAQSRDGVIWAASKSNGIFRFINDSVNTINRSNDLMSNYCYSILADAENNIWIGHEKGFSRFNPQKGIMRVFGADFVKGGVCNPDGMYESEDRKIFIGTTDGVIVYDREKDRKSETAPFTNINSVMINDVKYDYRPSYTLPYNKKYIIRISYTGINFSNPGKVFYSTYLENYDNDWSKLTTSREMSYGLRDGKYRFSLLSVNEDGVSQESAVSFDLLIGKPFWRTWWFVILAILGINGTIALIFWQRDKAQKKIQDYLESELAARTRVVLEQKGEIELQNIEITDSINYAKRIQSSILPDINKLRESFRDAFILFQPRDIVSGDFYWFDKTEEDKFILVCADSTGHGVPGAFMSMIGSTLLQDIVTRKNVTRPSEVLGMLDRQIFSTLNQNVELGVSNDGMDMVVCEFNIRTRHLRFASAMRPVILVMNGESYYVKGNRSSIGGESVNEKFFDDQEYYLNENDSIYLFSDGLSDQFGGPDGKKMKIARLRRMIEQVSTLPMEEQKAAISEFYSGWRGTYDQVDDILLMGVRV